MKTRKHHGSAKTLILKRPMQTIVHCTALSNSKEYRSTAAKERQNDARRIPALWDEAASTRKKSPALELGGSRAAELKRGEHASSASRTSFLVSWFLDELDLRCLNLLLLQVLKLDLRAKQVEEPREGDDRDVEVHAHGDRGCGRNESYVQRRDAAPSRTPERREHALDITVDRVPIHDIIRYLEENAGEDGFGDEVDHPLAEEHFDHGKYADKHPGYATRSTLVQDQDRTDGCLSPRDPAKGGNKCICKPLGYELLVRLRDLLPPKEARREFVHDQRREQRVEVAEERELTCGRER